ncbi:ABC transporter permease subunit [Pelagibacterium luteolum]|uniref:Putrescine transport system permease protein n=1 Tax=Pelagibacterium luteolum TaxID=440168 RepID=A0A1G7WNB2_9HYPH|nr:ABC transporter permease subunit [Pelagibacterium luteolum]SDG73432.1 putrescine transport system permease protein [Pelagibacterium luteolum]
MSTDGIVTRPRRARDFVVGWLSRVGISGRTAVILAPTLWLALFFLIPLLVVLKIAFSAFALGQPPYLPMFAWGADESLSITLHFSNFLFILQDALYANAYINSVRIAAISTAIALVIAYPMAWFIARSDDKYRNLLLMLVILPFWTSFLLRVYAWMGFLGRNGIINNALLGLGIIDQPITMLQTEGAVFVGIVYTYLPFMVLPIYTTLVKLDQSLIEASADLGARPFMTFLTVILPLSMPGVVAGSMLVFIPAIGEFVIPSLLGGADTLMIGRVLWDEFFANRDWPVASAVAIVMLVILVVPIMLLSRAQNAVVEKDA